MFYLTLFMTIVNSAIALYVWWTNRDKITNTRFKALEDKMIKIESDIQHPPACPHHPDFKLRLEAIDRGLSKIDGRLEGIGRMVDLLTQNELSGGKQ
jgi:hypothetical protein